MIRTWAEAGILAHNSYSITVLILVPDKIEISTAGIKQ